MCVCVCVFVTFSQSRKEPLRAKYPGLKFPRASFMPPAVLDWNRNSVEPPAVNSLAKTGLRLLLLTDVVLPTPSEVQPDRSFSSFCQPPSQLHRLECYIHRDGGHAVVYVGAAARLATGGLGGDSGAVHAPGRHAGQRAHEPHLGPLRSPGLPQDHPLPELPPLYLSALFLAFRMGPLLRLMEKISAVRDSSI